MATPRINPMLADGGEPGEFVPKASTKVTPAEREKRLREAAANAQAALDKYAAGTTPKTPTVKETPSADTIEPTVFGGITYTSRAALDAAMKQAELDAQKTREAERSASELAILRGQQQMAEAERLRARKSAEEGLKSWLSSFFDPTNDASTITNLMDFVRDQITNDIPPEAIRLNIRNQQFYKDRFSANEVLRKKGLAELAPEEYLAYEKKYSEILRNSGLTDLANRTTFNALIGGEVSTVELQDRITDVYDRINTADKDLQTELGKFFNMGLSKSDLAKALLTGTEGATALKRKVSMAEIGAEFTPRGLTSTLGTEQLANLGVTREQARKGAEYVRQGMPRLATLAGIYSQAAGSPEFATQLQGELEAEVFQGLESQRRKKLIEMEQAAFAGSAGIATPSLGRSSAGAI